MVYGLLFLTQPILDGIHQQFDFGFASRVACAAAAHKGAIRTAMSFLPATVLIVGKYRIAKNVNLRFPFFES